MQPRQHTRHTTPKRINTRRHKIARKGWIETVDCAQHLDSWTHAVSYLPKEQLSPEEDLPDGVDREAERAADRREVHLAGDARAGAVGVEVGESARGTRAASERANVRAGAAGDGTSGGADVTIGASWRGASSPASSIRATRINRVPSLGVRSQTNKLQSNRASAKKPCGRKCGSDGSSHTCTYTHADTLTRDETHARGGQKRQNHTSAQEGRAEETNTWHCWAGLPRLEVGSYTPMTQLIEEVVNAVKPLARA